MITEIDFKVRGEKRKKLAYAIGELLGMPVKYTRTPKFDYLIGSCVLDQNGVFHASEDMTESKLELVLQRRVNITVKMYPCSEGTDTGSPAL